MTSYPTGQHPFRNGLINQAGRKRRTSDDLPPGIGDYVPFLPPNEGQTRVSRESGQTFWEYAGRQFLHIGVQLVRNVMSWRPRQLLGLPLVLIVLWSIVLWWGEESVFRRNVNDCSWDRWETWPTSSNPHHVVFVADPQLVDPHTYPGRPWPLSTLTIRYTDLYMRKSFQQIQSILSPDSVFFLGDLFDGGREWSTYSGTSDERESPDKRWTKYDSRYWLKEYRRFSRIFFEPWLCGGRDNREAQPGRKLIAGLPGNHDLGLGGGIRIPVRDRFQAYFGEGNRFDVIGNHTFVSLDTVSLSAKGQPEVTSGEQGITHQAHKMDVWAPVDEFLQNAKVEKARIIERELRVRNGKSENEAQDHTPLELDDPEAYAMPHEAPRNTERISDIPSVILTHVPLYRAEGTPCGRLRERFPPSNAINNHGEALEKDDANSIKVQAGLQYQNVLTPAISNQIVDMVGDVTHVFSGDDHDYCDLIHHGYTSKNGGIREVTVKSISWAMGVRHPGFLLASLWNPVDEDGNALAQETAKTATIQTHLCLLPDQLSIFIKYGWLLAITVVSLFLGACRTASKRNTSAEADGYLLPLSKPHLQRSEDQVKNSTSARASSKDQLSVRSSAGRPRSLSPANGYGYSYSPSADNVNSVYENDRLKESLNGSATGTGWNNIALDESSHRKGFKPFVIALWDKFRSNVVQVASIVLVWYVWLLWNS